MNKKVIQSGLSIMEIVIVITILMILMTALLGTFANIQRRTILKSAAEDLTARVRDMQHRAVSGEGATRSPKKWGIRVDRSTDPDRYTAFSGVYSDNTDRTLFVLDSSLELDPVTICGASIGTAAPTTANDIIFTTVTGKPKQGDGTTDCSSANISIKLKNATDTFRISVNSEGQITLREEVIAAPSATTNAASSIATTTATLNGTATPNGSSTTGWFRYSATSPGTCNDSFGTRVPGSGGTSLGADWSGVAYSENISGLTAETTYYFCAIANNSLGTGLGTVASFTSAAPLVAHWKFDETSGTTASDSAGSNTGTLTNGPTWATTGRVDGAVNMDGSNDYVSVADSPAVSLTGNFTLSAWIYTASNTTQQGILEKYPGSGVNGYHFRLTSAGKLLIGTGDASSITQVTGSATISTNTWTHVAAVYNGSNAILYINGFQDASGANTRTPTDSTSVLRIGARGDDAALTFNGKIDDARIYTKALSATEIEQMYTRDSDGTNLINVEYMLLGYNSTCASTYNNFPYCWGGNGSGELGINNSTSKQTPVKPLKGGAASGDNDGNYLTNINAIGTGGGHTCALSVANSAYCIGQNFYGQLGDGTATNRSTAVRVLKGAAASGDNDGTYLTNVKSVVAAKSPYGSCCDSFTLAVSEAGNAYSWGVNGTHGSLGDGTSTNRSSPVRVLKGGAASGDNDGTNLTNIRQMAGGKLHGCAVSIASNAYCWGENSEGQLGNNSTTDSNTPVRVLKGAAVSGDNDGTYLTNIRSITAGDHHTCAVSNNNNVYCWGDATTRGQTGDNQATTDRLTPIRVLKGAAASGDNDGTYLNNADTISAGGYHTCVVSNNDYGYCWGYGINGGLGNNTTSDSYTPARVLKGAAASGDNDGTYLTNIATIVAGRFHTCAISNNKIPYCFGYNDQGQVGDNTTTQKLTPVRVLKGEAT